jgi:hypothetical protein
MNVRNLSVALVLAIVEMVATGFLKRSPGLTPLERL